MDHDPVTKFARKIMGLFVDPDNLVGVAFIFIAASIGLFVLWRIVIPAIIRRQSVDQRNGTDRRG